MTPIYLIAVFASFALADVFELGSGPGPSRDEDRFRQANMSPNATGSVYLEATNMSVDINMGSPVDWRAHLNVTEVTNLNYTHSPSDVVTNSVISIDTLGAWVGNSTRNTTIIIFTGLARNATVDGQRDKGDCFAALGKQCVHDYSMIISDSIGAQAASTTNTTRVLVIQSPPASCKYRLSSSNIMYRKSNLLSQARPSVHY